MRDAPKDALAICALYQGDLLLQKGEGKIKRSDAEIPLSEWENLYLELLTWYRFTH